MTAGIFSVTTLLVFAVSAYASHFRGGLIQWKSVDSTTIEIFHRMSWRRSRDDNILCSPEAQTLLGAQTGSLVCDEGCFGDVGLMSYHCTDFSVEEDWVTGTRTYTYTLPSPSISFEASFDSCCWISTLVLGADEPWEIRVKGNTTRRPDGIINSSPATSSLPIVRLQHGCSHVYRIPVADPNRDVVRCRWAISDLAECGGICDVFPNATLDEDTCTISYNATGSIGAYAVALQIEDYISANSTTPMSSVPLQFLVNVSASNQSCSEIPVLVPPTPSHGSCIAVPLGTTYITSLIAYSQFTRIQTFETVSPRGLLRSMLNRSSFNESLYYTNITWTPTLQQFGLHIFCFTAENEYRVTSEQSCITLVGGISGPRVLPTSIFPSGSFSPSSTTVWRMEYDQAILKPLKSHNLRIYEMGVDNPVRLIDVLSNAVVFPPLGSNGTSVTFMVDYNFEAEKSYYVLVEPGFAEGEQFCNQQSLEIQNQTFWTFKIPRIKLSPRFGNSLGGTPILIDTGIEFSESDKITCIFEDNMVTGQALSKSIAICVSPFLQSTNKFIPFKLRIGDRTPFDANFLTISPEIGHAVSVGGEGVTPVITPGQSILLSWDPRSLVPNGLDNSVTVDISFEVLNYDQFFGGFSFLTQSTLAEKTANDGEESIIMNHQSLVLCSSFTDQFTFFSVCPMYMKISISSDQYLSSDITIWSGALFFNSSLSSFFNDSLPNQCLKWYGKTQPIIASLQQLPHCPPNELIASFDLNFMKEDMTSSVTSKMGYHEIFMKYFHPEIRECYIQSIPNDNFGQQCCYGKDGVLVKDDPGGSTDASSPVSNYYAHVLRDLLPYILCCKDVEFSPCDTYYYGRPSGSETGYMFPKPAIAVGDPHIVTLDGLKYTFNGKGEFILIQTEGNTFTLQGRMEQVLDNNGNLAPGTVFTAIVANQHSPDATVQFEVKKSDGTLRTLVNLEEVSFGDINTLKFDGVALLYKGNNSILAWFSSGAYVEVSVMNGIIEVLMVGLPESLKRKTEGLMGSFNGIISDDLTPKGGQQPIPIDSSMETIHDDFGVTWIIDEASDSLFSYRPGENHGTFYFPNFSPMFSATFTNATLEKEAKEICGNDNFCLFDIAATGRVEIGAATMEEVKMVETIEEMTKPIICEPLCGNGVCTENNTCSCNMGFTGTRCNEAVIEECPQNLCQNNGKCSKQGSTYSCTCPPEFTGIFCQDKVPPFSIHMLNGSPQVLGNQVEATFSSSKDADIRCYLDNFSNDCSKGFITYSNVVSGSHILRIVATAGTNERAVIRRRIYVGICAVHLINDGVSVNGRQVTIEFSGTQDSTYFRCHIDGSKSKYCGSPLRYDDLASGLHTLVVEPGGCMGSKKGRLSLKFSI